MIALKLHMVGDGAYKDTPGYFKHGFITDMTLLEKGTQKGNLTVALRCLLDDGTYTIVETAWALLHSAVHAFEVTYGEPE